MRPILAIVLLVCAGRVSAQAGEDAAHRADRERTEALNRRSATGYAAAAPRPEDEAEYRRARADYLRRLDDWRRRVAACRAGAYDAC